MLIVEIEDIVFCVAMVAVVIAIKWLQIKWWRRRNVLKKRLNSLRSGEFTETLVDDAMYYPAVEEK